MKKLFIVFQVFHSDQKMSFCGIYEKESDAVNRILNDTTKEDFVLCGCKLNEHISTEMSDWEFSYYPKSEDRPVVPDWEDFS